MIRLMDIHSYTKHLFLHKQPVEVHPYNIPQELTDKHVNGYFPPVASEESGSHSNNITNKWYKREKCQQVTVLLNSDGKRIKFFFFDMKVFLDPFNFSQQPDIVTGHSTKPVTQRSHEYAGPGIQAAIHHC